MAGRKAGFRHSDETRAKIQSTLLIRRLMEHINSDEPIMDASQVNAAKALLNKVLPDLKSIDHQSSDGTMATPTTIQLVAAKNDNSAD